MSYKLLAAGLAVSVAFNVFFVVGMFGAREDVRRAATDEEWIDVLAERLGLDSEQKAAFTRWHEDYRAYREKNRDAMRERYEQFLAEIVKEDPDEGMIEQFIQAASGPERRRDMVGRARELMAILRPEQRREAVELIRGRYRQQALQSRRREEDGGPDNAGE